MKKERKKTSELNAGLPTFTSFHDGIFSDPSEAKKVLQSVASFLRGSESNQDTDQQSFLGFAIEETHVEFRTGLERMRLVTRFASGSLIILAPKQPNESEELLRSRETSILMEFSKAIGEAHMRSTLQFWRSLDKTAQEILFKKYASTNETT